MEVPDRSVETLREATVDTNVQLAGLSSQLAKTAQKSMNQADTIRKLLAAHLRTKRRLRAANDDIASLLDLLSDATRTTWKLMRRQSRLRQRADQLDALRERAKQLRKSV